MLHVHERAKSAALQFLRQHSDPISAEALAEEINYSVQQTYRIIATLRAEHILTSSRPARSRALAYQVNEEAAKGLGLL